MVMGVYKPPKFKFNMWKDQLYHLFESATSACEDILVLGDLNCDILHPSNNGTEGRHLLDMCEVFNLDCLIDEPTRLTTTSQTLIDVLLTNNKRRFLVSGTLEPHVSDHRLAFTVMKASHRHKKSMMITSRSYKCYDREKFLSDLSAVPFMYLLFLTMSMTRFGHFITSLIMLSVNMRQLSVFIFEVGTSPI